MKHVLTYALSALVEVAAAVQPASPMLPKPQEYAAAMEMLT